MNPAVFANRAAAWLGSLPAGEEVRWCHDVSTPAPGVHTGWVDVFVPEVCERLGVGWLVTIRAPGDPQAADADGVEVLVVDQDLWVGGCADPVTGWLDPATVVVGSTPPQSSDPNWRVRPAWSSAALCAALGDWAGRIAGRDDLAWVFDPSAEPDWRNI